MQQQRATSVHAVQIAFVEPISCAGDREYNYCAYLMRRRKEHNDIREIILSKELNKQIRSF
jgi:hypothetical protein